MRYLAFTVLGAILAALAYVALLAWSSGTPANLATASLAGWYQRKIEAANRTPSPRILIVGGSSNLYGVRADRIAAATGIPTVNFGTHAGLSLDCLLYEARKIARPGDTILLSLEYEFYTDKPNNAVGSDFVFGFDPGYLLSLPPRELANWLASASTDVVWRPLFDMNPRLLAQKNDRTAASAAQLDEFGDYIENRPEEQTPTQKQAVENARPVQALLAPKGIAGKKVWTELQGFADWCRANHIRLVATFPATIQRPAYSSRASSRAVKALIDHYQQIEVSILGNPQDFFRPADDFFDTVYHLNSCAAASRTDQLIALLTPWLQRSNVP